MAVQWDLKKAVEKAEVMVGKMECLLVALMGYTKAEKLVAVKE